MKRIISFCLLFGCICLAENFRYEVGFRSSKYGSVGFCFNQKWGATLENSIFVEEVEYQYVRIIGHYEFELPFYISGKYSLYSGVRYNRDFYDIGGFLDLKWNVYSQIIQVNTSFQPYYDSDLKGRFGYYFSIQIVPLSEVGFFIGIKNEPEYREIERRFLGGLVFALSHMTVKPEISVPIHHGLAATRVSVNFIYKKVVYD